MSALNISKMFYKIREESFLPLNGRREFGGSVLTTFIAEGVQGPLLQLAVRVALDEVAFGRRRLSGAILLRRLRAIFMMVSTTVR